jgi:DNA-binding XRE family transcriptional regulator
VPDLLPVEDMLINLGKELREIRHKAGLSQEQAAEGLGYGRDSMSKYELGLRKVSLYDYLVLMDFFRDVVPDHPGVALARRMLGRKTPRRKA